MSTDTALPRPHHFTRAEYHALAEQGLFTGCRVERIEGEIVDTSPQRSRHAATVSLVQQAVERAFGPDFYVRVQMPLELGADSDPEPDVAVTRGGARDFIAAHPRTAELVVEVAESTLEYDLGVKARLYAGPGIADYWVVDTETARLIVHRQPRGGSLACYTEVRVLHGGAAVAPLAASVATIKVTDLLP